MSEPVHVLVVEDHPLNRELAEAILQRAGYDVFTGRPKPSRARLAREAVAVLVR